MELNDVFEKALGIAVEVHRGQVDKLGMPYILHPLAVSSKLDSLELKIVGLLHDTIEDADITAGYLLDQGIPRHLVDAVQLLTKSEDEEYESYLNRVKENPIARAVKLADLAHNTDPSRASGLNEKRREKYALAKKILAD